MNLKFIYVITLFTLSITSCNSQSISDKQAIKRRDERLAYLNSLKRHFIKEGVYVSHIETIKSSVSKDKFGNIVNLTGVKNTVDYEIAFTQAKLIILNDKAGIKEEFIFNDNIKITSISPESTSYAFEISSWKIKKQSDETIIEDILSKHDKNDGNPRVILMIDEDKIPKLNLYFGFRLGAYDQTLDKSKGPFSTTSRPFLYLDELKYTYSDVFGPEYINSARYEDIEYDLDNYRR